MRSYVNRLLLAAFAALALGASEAEAEEKWIAAHMAQGAQYLEQGEFGAAIFEYMNVLQIDRKHAAAHYGLGNAYLNNNRPVEGLWEIRETVRLDSENFDAKVLLSQLLISAGDTEEALGLGDATVAQDPTKPSGHLIRARALEALRRPDEARVASERADALTE